MVRDLAASVFFLVLSGVKSIGIKLICNILEVVCVIAAFVGLSFFYLNILPVLVTSTQRILLLRRENGKFLHLRMYLGKHSQAQHIKASILDLE